MADPQRLHKGSKRKRSPSQDSEVSSTSPAPEVISNFEEWIDAQDSEVSSTSPAPEVISNVEDWCNAQDSETSSRSTSPAPEVISNFEDWIDAQDSETSPSTSVTLEVIRDFEDWFDAPQLKDNKHLSLEHKIISGSLFRKDEWRTHVDQYKMTVRQKYAQQKDQYFHFGEEASLNLYTEPDIIQTSKNGEFKNICVDEMFESKICLGEPMSVILQGNSGSGKSFITQKILLDWASGERYLNFHLVFYLKYEELINISEQTDLCELLNWSSNIPSDLISDMIFNPLCKVLLLIDGVDELRLMCPEYCMLHESKKARPEVIVCALVCGEILLRSTLLVTTKTEVIQGTMLKRSQLFTKIAVFSEKKIEEYFQKFYQDEKFFRKAYESVGSNETLSTACSIPLICWIVCTVIRERFNDDADLTRGLETTTSIYVEFVSTVLEHHCQGLNESVPNLLRSLGHLAERGMLDQQVLFDKKNIQETVQDPVNNPFLNKFLLDRRIQQETMYRFIHLSFQEFFTALYFVLLDEDESQKKVRELLHTVERGWTLSSVFVADFLIRDPEIRSSKQLQSVILFLCGLCKNEMIDSFFKKHNVNVSINIETQLKEWIHQCLLRYQHENMMFILHCLYELHDKTFIGKVLKDLILDLSNISLNKTDCWVLRFCLQCCERIRNLKLNVTSDHLKILQPALHSCEELWLTVDHISDEIVGWISAFQKEKMLNKLILKVLKSETCPTITVSVEGNEVTCFLTFSRLQTLHCEITFTFTCLDICTINWKDLEQALLRTSEWAFDDLVTFMQSVSGLKNVRLQVSRWTDRFFPIIMFLLKGCPTLNEISLLFKHPLKLVDVRYMKASFMQAGWTLTGSESFIVIQQKKMRFPEELKTEKYRDKSREKELDCGSFSTLASESSSGQLVSEDIEMFIPEIVLVDVRDKQNITYRFVSPHAGQFQCRLTNLVFVNEGKGEVLYKIVPWDPQLLDGLGQMQPAGPLYNIDCFKGSISQLHLPHCEILSEKSKDSLGVAHFSDGNVEMLQSIKVSSTHVIINITEFSLFGLIKKIIFPVYPVCAQVLLFLRPKSVAHKQKILNVHLLPGNVPLSEVQSQHLEKTYIETSSICHLIPGREYKLCCHPDECEVQPLDEVFECNFGPNYHTTFEVFLNVSIEEVRLGLLDSNNKGKEVWKQRRVLLSAPAQGEEPLVGNRFTESEFVDKHRDQLIQRVTSVMETADCLMSKDMITSEMYKKVHSAEPRQEKMRIVFDVLESGGSAVKAEFCRLLKEKEPHLVDELESEPSRTQ